MMDKWIALLGANATGKSTRMAAYVESLGDPDCVLNYAFEKNGELKVIKGAGSVYGDMFVVGRPTRSGKWAGGDHTMGALGSIACVHTFFEYLDSKGIKTVVFEAYFGNNSTMYRPERLFEFFKEVHCRWFLYDDLQGYVDRTENRCGQTWEDKGKDPSQSAGWRNNVAYFRALELTSKQVVNTSSTVKRVSINAPADWLIGEIKEIL